MDHGINKLSFFHQEFSNYFLKGTNGLQICGITCLFSKTNLYFLNHIRVSSQDGGSTWVLGQPSSLPASFHLTLRRFYAYPRERSVLPGPHPTEILPWAVSSQPLLAQGCTHQCYKISREHTQNLEGYLVRNLWIPAIWTLV